MADDAAYLRSQAQRCRRLAATVSTKDVAATLLGMAQEYEDRADGLDPGEPDAGPATPD